MFEGKKRPTIAELDATLNQHENPMIHVHPDGSISAGEEPKAEQCMRMKATDVLRQRANEMRRKANGLTQLANTLDEIERMSLASAKDGCEGSIPYVGVGSGAEEALWEMAVKLP